MECICTKVFARVFAGFLFIRKFASSSSSTNIGELALSAMVVSTGAVRREQELGARRGGCGESSQVEAMGVGVPSESWSTPRNTLLKRKNKELSERSTQAVLSFRLDGMFLFSFPVFIPVI